MRKRYRNLAAVMASLRSGSTPPRPDPYYSRVAGYRHERRATGISARQQHRRRIHADREKIVERRTKSLWYRTVQAVRRNWGTRNICDKPLNRSELRHSQKEIRISLQNARRV